MKLIETEVPRFAATPTAFPPYEAAEYDARLERTRAATIIVMLPAVMTKRSARTTNA